MPSLTIRIEQPDLRLHETFPKNYINNLISEGKGNIQIAFELSDIIFLMINTESHIFSGHSKHKVLV